MFTWNFIYLNGNRCQMTEKPKYKLLTSDDFLSQLHELSSKDIHLFKQRFI